MKRMLDIDELLGTVGLLRASRAGGAGSFLVGLGVGIIGGCAAALLLTPYSGPEARQKLARASNDLGKQVQGKVGELKQQFANRQDTSVSYGQIGSQSPRVGI
jgi:gas vesicle protein